MDKQELRTIYLKKRKELSPSDLALRSELIMKNFVNFTDLSQISFLHSFIPIEKRNEPDTWMIIDHVQNNFPQVCIVVPKVNSTGLLDNYLLKDKSELVVNSWGIPEPSGTEKVTPDKLDIILVPLLIFDSIGHRVGYGKGFYDRLLSECRPDAMRVGISLFDGVQQIDDVDDHDQPLHHCITPNRVISF